MRCAECGIHACDRCWRGRQGACPGCGAPAKPVTAVSGSRAGGAGQPSRLRFGRRPAALGAAVLAASLVVLVIGNPFRPVGAVEGTQEGPGAIAGASAEADDTAASLPSAPGDIAIIDEEVTPAPSPTATNPSPVPTADSSPPPSTDRPPRAAAVTTNPTPRPTARQGPAPTPTRAPRPTPTTRPGTTPTPSPIPLPPPPSPLASPTPSPTPMTTPTPTPMTTPTPTPVPAPTATPTPAPTPGPTPGCATVPNLVGMTVSQARSAWADAGFTGVFTPTVGQNNKIVESQSQAVGDCLPITVPISVTHS